MTIFLQPPQSNWASLINRPQFDTEILENSLRTILDDVKKNGDKALYALTERYDGAKLDTLCVATEEIEMASLAIDPLLGEAMILAIKNIYTFHASQVALSKKIETMPGVVCWREFLPIQKVGLYVPGGTAPLFSTVLMLGIPARLAGCDEIILCTPPQKNGQIHPNILFAASLCGIKKIVKIGGAQAIAAMAYGTASVPSVYKIFGPGNQYVTKAKQIVNREGTAIDMPAGPSEIMIIADEFANVSFVAADLLSQAEHGTDSHVVLVALSHKKIIDVQKEMEIQLTTLPRAKIASATLQNSIAIAFDSMDVAIQFANEYAPEHLIINTLDCDTLVKKIKNAGSVFLGPWSPEAVGDYASGTNHTLPTNGFAKSYSGISVESFMKTMTVQKLSLEGLKVIGPWVEHMAQSENLDGHKKAISIRLQVEYP